MNIILNDSEKLVLEKLLGTKIESIKKTGGDPFFTADIVSIYRKLTGQSTQTISPVPEIEVMHGGADDTETPTDKPDENAPTNKPRVSKSKVVVTEEEITPDNIDKMTDALTEDSKEDDDLVIEKLKPKTTKIAP